MMEEASFLRDLLVVALTSTPPWRIRNEISPETNWMCWVLSRSSVFSTSSLIYSFMRDTKAYVQVANHIITRVILVRWRVMNGEQGCKRPIKAYLHKNFFFNSIRKFILRIWQFSKKMTFFFWKMTILFSNFCSCTIWFPNLYVSKSRDKLLLCTTTYI